METLEPMPTTSQETPKQEKRISRGQYFGMVAIALVFGFLGGLIAPRLSGLSDFPFQPKKKQEVRQETGTTITPPVSLVAEDDAVVNVVEKNSPAVVSIVITKDVPQVRRFFNTPFGNGFPFFSDPFQNEDTQGNGRGETQKRQVGSGSGFFVSSDGLVVTNKHVASDTQADYTVITTDGKEYPAKVLARDPNNDIAVLKVEGKDFPALSLGDSDVVRVGQTAIVIGNPLGEFANSVSRGIISGLKRSVTAGSGFGDEEKLTGIIQTDAAINPGNSGGPLLNISGQVIGVNVAMAQGAENIGFALPINQVKRIVEQVRTTGKITTPYIGVRYVLLNDEIQKENNLPYNYGALVLRGQNMTDFAVIPGSPADKAGIVENDVILEIGGTKVDEEHPLGNLIAEHNVGDEITLKLWHKGDTKDVKVKLEERK